MHKPDKSGNLVQFYKEECIMMKKFGFSSLVALMILTAVATVALTVLGVLS